MDSNNSGGNALAWCLKCGKTARFGEWGDGGQGCPHCGGHVSGRFAWEHLRRVKSRLPEVPEADREYWLDS